MAKRYRRKQPKPKAQPEKKPFPTKKVLIFLGILLPVFSFYQISLALGWNWIIHVYSIAAGVLAAAYVIYNRGVFSVPKEDDLPDTMTGAEKQALIETIRSHKEKSSVLLYALGPILVTVTYDVIYLYMTVTLGMTF